MDRDLANPLWCERYRPRRVANMILPSGIKKKFLGMIAAKEIPNLILAGSPGTGKTTAAQSMFDEIDVDFYKLNASLEGNIDTLRNKVVNYASTYSFKGTRKYVFLDEADYLTYATQPPLRGVIEDVSGNAGFIFTVNYPERLIEPIRSRCAVIEFKMPAEEEVELKTAYYKRVIDILNLENVKYDKKVVMQVVEKFFPDMRKVLNELQSYSNSGAIDTGILAVMKDAALEDLVEHMKTKSYSGARIWVGENINVGSGVIFRKIYDAARDIVTPESVPPLVVVLGKYQYQEHFVADKEINLAACVAEIIAQVTFK